MNRHDDLVPYMRRVQSAERDLRDLGVVWQMIESSAAISCPEEAATILPTLVSTRQRFDGLQTRLIEQMVHENHAALGDELSARAQCAIDILVRNLFERTADVGFLASDEVLRAFCAAPAHDHEAQADAVVERLSAYQAKYSVYEDIIVLSRDARVLARLACTAASTAPVSDPIVAAALQSTSYVERFGTSDLAPDAQPVLQYAHRIPGPHGQPSGVLVMRFRFADEMRRIFADMEDEHHQLALMLVDEDQRVISSNDEAHVPQGAALRPMPEGQIALTAFSGREYLAVSCRSHGYQGYAGPRWRAQAMVSLLTAFRQRKVELDPDANIPIENRELILICQDADAINRDLRRVVWNGRIASQQLGQDDERGSGARVDSLRLKAVLSQVNQAGQRTRARVDQATRDLYFTAMSRSRVQTQDLARLAADIMDRNLYERANDCRWWALSPTLQKGLSDPDANPQAMQEVLDHIQSLYTVYSRLVVFDAQGVVRACSLANEPTAPVPGTAIDPAWLQQVLRLHQPQAYAVSEFQDTPLHDGGATYTYLAAIRAPATAQIVGGIAIVFQSVREFSAMLQDVLADRSGFAAYVDAQGQVIASTAPDIAGTPLTRLPREHGLVEHEGVHYACARVRTKGYREFKHSDGYDNGISAVVGLRLGAAERRRTTLGEQSLLTPARSRSRQPVTEVAVFQVGGGRYALPANAIFEAVSPKGLVRTPTHHPLAMGLLEFHDGTRPRMLQVICARRYFGLDYPARATDGVVLVLRSPQCPDLPALGLQVDDVATVMSFPTDRLHPAPPGMSAFMPAVTGLLHCDVDTEGERSTALIQMLDAAIVTGEVLGGTPASAESCFTPA